MQEQQSRRTTKFEGWFLPCNTLTQAKNDSAGYLFMKRGIGKMVLIYNTIEK